MATNMYGNDANYGRRPHPSRLPHFGSIKKDDKLKEQWQQVPARFFDNDEKRPIDYDITDEMLHEYSQQFAELGKVIEEHMKGFRTMHQLAWKHKKLDPGSERKEPNFKDRSYFAIQWTVAPICRGPVENACGCGCG